jgi:hypothetical protein
VIDVFGCGPGLAAAWVAVKDIPENAIAAVTAIMEIVVFMFHSYERVFFSLSMRATSENTIQ